MKITTSKGINIHFVEDGDINNPVIIMISGLGQQIIDWPEDIVLGLVKGGHRVIRVDNRDVGYSQDFSRKSILLLIWRYILYTLFHITPYTISDMAEDIREIMDFNKIEKAHILGWSMGGMIAQRLAIGYPHRIKSLICMMSSGGAPKRNYEIIKLFYTPPKSKRFEDRVQRVTAIHKKIMSPKYPISDHELRLHVEKSMRYSKEGGKSGLGVANQYMAINVDNSRFKLLYRITAPTLVLHGEEDVMIYVSDAIALAKAISGSRLITYPGMGHDFPAVLIPKFIEEITNHIKTASFR